MHRAAILLLLIAISPSGRADEALTIDRASHFARLALRCVEKELPNKIDHLINDPSDVKRPKDLHPAFYGCLDWHSSVHGHWMLVRLLRTFPALPEAAQIRKSLDATITAENILAEVAYFSGANRQSFERTYGWAWLLQLAAELDGWNDTDGKRWALNLQPLTHAIVDRYLSFLPKQSYPIRTGVHPNTAFGLALALDYARATRHPNLEALILERAMTYYGKDADVPASWEPGGEDFLSPALIEADLMRRVLPGPKFPIWLHAFLPRGLPASLQTPALVTDRTDPKLAHLDGLNLSRAWCLRAIANALPAKDSLREPLLAAADIHTRQGLEHVATGNYMGEHWLASFAVYLLGVERAR